MSQPQKTNAAYPLGHCIAGIVMGWAGLAAAGLGIKWGVAPPAGDALREAWPYVNEMTLLAITIAWPALSLRGLAPSRGSLLVQGAAVLVGALPSIIVAAFLSATGAMGVAHTVGLQLAAAILAAGVIAWGERFKPAPALLAAWIVCGPVAAFIWADFLPRAWNGWMAALPAVALRDSENGGHGAIWIVVSAHAVLGGLLLVFARSVSRPAAK